MSDDKLLTSQVAAQFLQNHEDMNLSDFTSIEDEAAEMLAELNGSLYLNGLLELSDSAARSLGKHRGSLWLSSVTFLSPVAAKSLASHEPAERVDSWDGHLGLSSIAKLPFEHLVYFEGFNGNLTLGLTEVSDADASVLCTVKGGLSLDLVETLNSNAAKYFSKFSNILSLSGLRWLSDQAIEYLTLCPRAWLSGFRHIGSSRLAKYILSDPIGNGEVSLTELDYASEELVDIICETADLVTLYNCAMSEQSECKLREKFGDRDVFDESWFAEEISKELAHYHVCVEEQDLSEYRKLGKDAAEIFYKSNIDSLYLEGLSVISDEEADLLSKFAGDLHLGGLTIVTTQSARLLGNHKGYLDLDGLTSISDRAAEGLANHEGELSLCGLFSVSDEAATALRQKKGDIGIDLKKLPLSARAILSTHPSLVDQDGV